MAYTSLNDYCKKTFGCKVYKIALDGGFTCPNRDGSLGTGGCIFCSQGGSGEFSQSRLLSVTDQIERGKEFIQKKMPKGQVKYIAYFQAFTGTYAPLPVLRAKYTEAIRHPDIAVLSIATRPDCLGPDVLDLLSEMNMIKPVWVELGLQTVKEESVGYIRRGYENEVYDRAVRECKSRGLLVVTHVILGLPGETKEDMLNTVRHVVAAGSDGIKLQLLQVLSGTDLEKDYLAGKFECLTMEEYLDILKDCLTLLPKEMVVHRLTGDPDKKLLVAPKWCTDKKKVLNAIQKRIRETEALK